MPVTLLLNEAYVTKIHRHAMPPQYSRQWHDAESQDKSILIGAKVEIMTKPLVVTEKTTKTPHPRHQPTLSYSTPHAVLRIYFYRRAERRKEKKLHGALCSRWPLFFFSSFLRHSLGRVIVSCFHSIIVGSTPTPHTEHQAVAHQSRAEAH